MIGIFCAIDAASIEEAEHMARKIAGLGLGIKAGLELYTAEGPSCIAKLKKIAGAETPVFLDLKLHDIPNTVAGAVNAAVKHDIDYLTIHTSGGREMMSRAVDAAAGSRTKILGVTVLTHMDETDLDAVGQQKPAADQVSRLAKLAEESGLAGVVCSSHEIAPLRKILSPKMQLVVPGIRPAGAAADDQKRVMTPEEASKLGADWLVIGRPITQAQDPAQSARDILKSLSRKAA